MFVKLCEQKYLSKPQTLVPCKNMNVGLKKIININSVMHYYVALFLFYKKLRWNAENNNKVLQILFD